MLISLLGMEHSEILDEVAPLEDYFVTTFNTRFPGCDLSECSHEELILTIRKAVSLGSISAANFVEAVKRVPVILKKMRLVGRIRSIRRLLCSNIMVAFLGPRGSGASTTVQRLFDVKVPALEIVPFEPLSGLSLFQQVPHPYILGQWMEKAVEESKEFADWIGKHNRAGLQVYAVDFPGVHSDIPIIDDSSLLFADVATMFVLFFTAGSLPTQEEKKIVDIAKSQRKPFLVLVNKCDLIEDVLTSSASYDTMLEKYAAALDVPSDLIHFVSSFDSYSNDKLRGIIFGLLQSIVGDTNLQDVLALRFVPGHVVDELKSDSTFNILDSAGILSKASASLMFNLCPFTYGTVGDMFTMMMSDDQRAFSCLSSESSTAVLSKNILKLSFSAIDKIRQLAISLQISDAAYNVFFESFTQRVNFAKVQLVKTVVINFESLPLDLQLKMDNAVSVIALAAMRDQLSSYFTKTSFASRDDTEAVSREVLLGIHSMTELWLERGYEQSIVSRVLKNVLTSSEPITDSAVLTLLLQEQPRHEELHSKSGFEHKEDLESYGNLEFNKFVAAKDRLKQLSKVLLFQPLPEFFAVETTRSNDSSKEDLIDGFRKKLKSLLSTHNKEVLVTLTSSENMLIEVLNNLMLMSQDQIKCSNLRFQILSESAVDASGVTRAVLAKVAQEINSRPELVYLKRDEDSKLIYFDPNACCYNIRLTDAFAETSIDVIYRGLGRLIGLCMLKSNVGATLPINFPITFYKFLLGYRIGFEDMNAISPQIANSIRSISILDSDSLKVMELTFVASTGVDQRDFELVPHGSSKTVTDHNIMTYVTEMVKFYLGCKDRDFQSDLEAPRTPLRQFILGKIVHS